MTTPPNVDRAFLRELDARLQRYSTHDAYCTASKTMDDIAFLGDYSGDASLTVLEPGRSQSTLLKGIDLDCIAEVAPVLAYAFEDTAQGPKHSIEDTSLLAVVAMLRYIYTRQHYVPDDCSDDQMSLLLHAEVFRLAVLYDVPDLKKMARARMFLELELSISYPGPPEDLCKALAYAYKHLPTETQLTKTLAHYCITCFLQHRLNQDELFKTFHYECRPFQRDLCLILRENRFEDETAPTLIKLPIDSSAVPPRYPVHDPDPLSAMLTDEFDDETRRRAHISRLDRLKIHFRVTIPER